MAKRKILIATTNSGKLKELSEMLAGDFVWLGLKDFPNITEIAEDGATFAENARKKAVGYAKQTGLCTIADDSGLVVDALGGAPGVQSARFSGGREKNKGLLDHKNMSKLLNLMKEIPQEKRTARFVCRICMADSQKILIETEGLLEGIIADSPVGQNGFGYDPIFFVPQAGLTVAQMPQEQKNQISHRAAAVKKLKAALENSGLSA